MKVSLLFLSLLLGLFSIGYTKDHHPAKHLVSEDLQHDKIPCSIKLIPVNPTPVDPNSDKLIAPFWVNTDVGFSSLGIAGDVGINLMIKDKFIISATAFGTTSSTFTIFQTKSWTDFSSYSFTIGKVLSSDLDKVLVSLSAGVSYSVIDKHIEISGGWFGSNFEEKKVNTIGFPVNLKFCIPTQSAIGLNLDLRADINQEQTFFSFLIGFRIGRIQKKFD